MCACEKPPSQQLRECLMVLGAGTGSQAAFLLLTHPVSSTWPEMSPQKDQAGWPLVMCTPMVRVSPASPCEGGEERHVPVHPSPETARGE